MVIRGSYLTLTLHSTDNTLSSVGLLLFNWLEVAIVVSINTYFISTCTYKVTFTFSVIKFWSDENCQIAVLFIV